MDGKNMANHYSREEEAKIKSKIRTIQNPHRIECVNGDHAQYSDHILLQVRLVVVEQMFVHLLQWEQNRGQSENTGNQGPGKAKLFGFSMTVVGRIGRIPEQMQVRQAFRRCLIEEWGIHALRMVKLHDTMMIDNFYGCWSSYFRLMPP